MADLKPANENPWYVLMTLYGEQDGETELADNELNSKNREVWNAWASQAPQPSEQLKKFSRVMRRNERIKWVNIEAEILKRHQDEMRKRNSKEFLYPGFPDFSAPIDLSGVHFKNSLWLSSLHFYNSVSFKNSRFSGEVHSVSAIFCKDTKFSFAIFDKRIGFDESTFLGSADFLYATFRETTKFREVIFGQGCQFSFAEFKKGASFSDLALHSFGSFVLVEFGGDADFQNVKFCECPEFTQSQFSASASFSRAMFPKGATFNSCIFLSRASFKGACFGDEESKPEAPVLLELTDAQFDKPASFSGAFFSNRFPDFTGAVVHEKTIFPFQKHAWPQTYPLFDEDWKPEEHDNKRIALMREAANSCAFLRHHVKGQGLPEAEYLFFKREMGFLAEIGGWWQRLPYRLFGLTEYGTSISRPAYALLVVVLISALIFQCYFSYQEMIDPYDYGRFESLSLSFSNTFRFFGLQGLFFEKTIARLPGQLETLAAVQTICGFVGTFFLGLGLRARFRLR